MSNGRITLKEDWYEIKGGLNWSEIKPSTALTGNALNRLANTAKNPGPRVMLWGACMQDGWERQARDAKPGPGGGKKGKGSEAAPGTTGCSGRRWGGEKGGSGVVPGWLLRQNAGRCRWLGRRRGPIRYSCRYSSFTDPKIIIHNNPTPSPLKLPGT